MAFLNFIKSGVGIVSDLLYRNGNGKKVKPKRGRLAVSEGLFEISRKPIVRRLDELIDGDAVFGEQPEEPELITEEQKRKYMASGLYSQLYAQIGDECSLEEYLRGIARSVGIITEIEEKDENGKVIIKEKDNGYVEFSRILQIIADTGTLSVYNCEYDKGNNPLFDKAFSSITTEQLRAAAKILVADEYGSKLKKRSSDAIDYYQKRFFDEKNKKGKQLGLYKTALTSEVVARVGFNTLADKIGRKRALALSQRAARYSSVDNFIENERKVFEKYMENRGSRCGLFRGLFSRGLDNETKAAYDIIFRDMEGKNDDRYKARFNGIMGLFSGK